MNEQIYLTGYRGSGKTVVGTIIAQRLDCALVDLDDVVEKRAGKTIAEIFRSEGEQGFRDRESAALREIPGECRSVVSLGGGAILGEQNRRWIREHGVCIWLDATPGALAERIREDPTSPTRRPALTAMGAEDEIRDVLAARRPLYEEVSDLRIQTDGKSTEEVAAELMEWWGRRGG